MVDATIQIKSNLNPRKTRVHSIQEHGAIGDVANWKRHQWLDEILNFFFYPTTSEKSAKLFSKKNSCHAIRPRNIVQSGLRSIRLL